MQPYKKVALVFVCALSLLTPLRAPAMNPVSGNATAERGPDGERMESADPSTVLCGYDTVLGMHRELLEGRPAIGDQPRVVGILEKLVDGAASLSLTGDLGWSATRGHGQMIVVADDMCEYEHLSYPTCIETLTIEMAVSRELLCDLSCGAVCLNGFNIPNWYEQNEQLPHHKFLFLHVDHRIRYEDCSGEEQLAEQWQRNFDAQNFDLSGFELLSVGISVHSQHPRSYEPTFAGSLPPECDACIAGTGGSLAIGTRYPVTNSGAYSTQIPGYLANTAMRLRIGECALAEYTNLNCPGVWHPALAGNGWETNITVTGATAGDVSSNGQTLVVNAIEDEAIQFGCESVDIDYKIGCAQTIATDESLTLATYSLAGNRSNFGSTISVDGLYTAGGTLSTTPDFVYVTVNDFSSDLAPGELGTRDDEPAYKRLARVKVRLPASFTLQLPPLSAPLQGPIVPFPPDMPGATYNSGLSNFWCMVAEGTVFDQWGAPLGGVEVRESPEWHAWGVGQPCYRPNLSTPDQGVAVTRANGKFYDMYGWGGPSLPTNTVALIRNRYEFQLGGEDPQLTTAPFYVKGHYAVPRPDGTVGSWIRIHPTSLDCSVVEY